MTSKRIGILVVAYNAVATLAQVLDRIPTDFRSRISKVLVGDDASDDSTHLVALGLPAGRARPPARGDSPPQEPGYGGNQKAGYQWAIDNGLDIVVLLHGDGQYAPEMLPEMVAPLERGEADAVFGSRMLDPGGARRGGMPRYKFVGNRILTTVENIVAGASLSEWHSGYRAYSVAALGTCRSAATTTGSTSTRRSSSSSSKPARRSSRCRSRPTTATRSATSTGSATPATSPATSCATAPTRWASAAASWPSPARPTTQGGRRIVARPCRALAREPPAGQGPRPRLLRRLPR